MNNEQNYTEQPFNLETALKHPEWVRTRDGREIDFIKEYAELGSNWLIVVLNDGDRFSATKDGFCHSIQHTSNRDLILRMPYREVWVNFYSTRECYYFESKELADEFADNNRLQ